MGVGWLSGREGPRGHSNDDAQPWQEAPSTHASLLPRQRRPVALVATPGLTQRAPHTKASRQVAPGASHNGDQVGAGEHGGNHPAAQQLAAAGELRGEEEHPPHLRGASRRGGGSAAETTSGRRLAGRNRPVRGAGKSSAEKPNLHQSLCLMLRSAQRQAAPCIAAGGAHDEPAPPTPTHQNVQAHLEDVGSLNHKHLQDQGARPPSR